MGPALGHVFCPAQAHHLVHPGISVQSLPLCPISWASLLQWEISFVNSMLSRFTWEEGVNAGLSALGGLVGTSVGDCLDYIH